jgi:uncharacterized membrane protein YhaH (DUF805 family)
MYRYGRINRPTYFLGLAILVLAYGLMITFMTKPPGMGEVMAVLLTVPRLHDIGKSAWWAFGVFVAEIVVLGVAAVFAAPAHLEEVILMASGLFVFVVLGLMVWLGCIRGDQQANRYGEPPSPGLSVKTYRMAKTPAVGAEGLNEP